jgi:hypothetical protein
MSWRKLFTVFVFFKYIKRRRWSTLTTLRNIKKWILEFIKIMQIAIYSINDYFTLSHIIESCCCSNTTQISCLLLTRMISTSCFGVWYCKWNAEIGIELICDLFLFSFCCCCYIVKELKYIWIFKIVFKYHLSSFQTWQEWQAMCNNKKKIQKNKLKFYICWYHKLKRFGFFCQGLLAICKNNTKLCSRNNNSIVWIIFHI